VARGRPEYGNLLIRVRGRGPDDAYPLEGEFGDGISPRAAMRVDLQGLLATWADPERYGTMLSEALFTGPVGEAFRHSIERAERRRGRRLRMQLWVDEAAPELQGLSWERLYHVVRGFPVPVSITATTPFSRYTALDLPEPVPVPTRPIRLLFVVSNPTDLPAELAPLDVDAEIRNVADALGDLHVGGQLDVTVLPGRSGLSPTLRGELHDQGYQIRDGDTSFDHLVRLLDRYHAVHFVGHGRFRAEDGGGGTAWLYLEREGGGWEAATDGDLSGKLVAMGSVPSLVFLAACQTASTARDGRPFVGLAPKLVRAGVPAVVAMQDVVPMPVARQLTFDFYRNLAEHGLVDLALNQARLVLFDRREVDWSIPVLFTRLRGGRLFAPEGLANKVVGEKGVLESTAHGAGVTRAGRLAEPVPQSRPVRLLPRPFPGLLDRDAELAAAIEGVGSGAPVQLYGESGSGRTSLLRELPQRLPSAPDEGAVYLPNAARPVEDVMQFLFEALFLSDAAVKPTEAQLRTYLRDARVLFELDDMDVPPQQVEALLNSLPSTSIVLASNDRSVPSDARAVLLRGLPEGAGVELFQRALGRAIAEEEHADVAAICRAVEGRPLAITQAAALVRDSGQSVREALALVEQRVRTTGKVTPVAALTAEERRVIGVLAGVEGAPIHPDHVEAIAGAPAATDVLDRLAGLGIARAASPEFALTEPLAPPDEREVEADRWAHEVFTYFTRWCLEHQHDLGRILEEMDTLLAVLDRARRDQRGEDFLRLARLVEPALVLGRRWGAWRQLLDQELAVATTLGSREAEAWALHQLGTRALGEQETGTARRLLKDALKLRKSRGDREGAKLTRHNLRLAQPFLLRWWRPLVVAAAASLVAFGGWQLAVGGGVLSADPGEVRFPDVPVGATSQVERVVLTNEEGRRVVIKSVQLRGLDPEDFLLDEGCHDRTLSSGESCTVALRFRPTVGGVSTAELVVTPAAGDPLTLELQATGLVSVSLSAPLSVEEGDAEAEQAIEFTVSLTAGSRDPVSVGFGSIEGTATEEQDYERIEGTLTFSPGDKEEVVSIPIIGDVLDEFDETLSLLLFDPDGAVIADGQSEAVMLLDDDDPPIVSVAPQEVNEPDEGSTEITFIARLSGPSGRSVRVDYAIKDGTATAKVDYDAAEGAFEGTLGWEPGETEKLIRLHVLGDLLDEPNETFSIELSNPEGAELPETERTPEATGTILDNDPPPFVSISDAKVTEGDPPAQIEATFEVVLSSVSGLDVTVQAFTAEDQFATCIGSTPGHARPGEDYVDVEEPVAIQAGQTKAMFTVPIISDDSGDCPVERFFVILSGATNASVEDGQAVGTIQEDNDID